MLFAACNISHRGRELQRTKLLCCQPRQGWRKTENEGERERGREKEGGGRERAAVTAEWSVDSTPRETDDATLKSEERGRGRGGREGGR